MRFIISLFMTEKCPEELLHGCGPARELLLAGGADKPLNLSGTLYTHQMTTDTLEDPGGGLHGVEADGALWTRQDLWLGSQLGQLLVQLLLLSL